MSTQLGCVETADFEADAEALEAALVEDFFAAAGISEAKERVLTSLSGKERERRGQREQKRRGDDEIYAPHHVEIRGAQTPLFLQTAIQTVISPPIDARRCREIPKGMKIMFTKFREA